MAKSRGPSSEGSPTEALQRVKLRVLCGKNGTDRVYCLSTLQPAEGLTVLFVGDQIEARYMSKQCLTLQDPRQQAVIMADKWPACNVAVIMPSRLEGCYACYDHFLGQTTASGEPLGFSAADLRATTQLASLLLDSGLWENSGPPTTTANSEDASDASAKSSVQPLALAAAYGIPSHPCFGASAHRIPSGLTPHGLSQDAVSTPNTADSIPSSASHSGKRLPIRVAGFSKGGVVLNQLLAELAACAEFASQSMRSPCHVLRSHSLHAAEGPTHGSSLIHTATATGVYANAPTTCPGAGNVMPAVSEGSGTHAAPSMSVSLSRHAAMGGVRAVPPNGGVGRIGSERHGTSPKVPKASHPQSDAAALLRTIRELHYLDAGLNCRGAYITDPNVAKGLKLLSASESCLLPPRPPKLFLHGTPRQWDDPTRPWLRDEVDRCQQLLKGAGVQILVRKYFANEKPSLDMHFEVLRAFQTTEELTMQ